MVPVGEGMGDTNGDTRVVSTLRGVGTAVGGAGWVGPRSSRREVKASLICVEGKRMIHLCVCGTESSH